MLGRSAPEGQVPRSQEALRFRVRVSGLRVYRNLDGSFPKSGDPSTEPKIL